MTGTRRPAHACQYRARGALARSRGWRVPAVMLPALIFVAASPAASQDTGPPVPLARQVPSAGKAQISVPSALSVPAATRAALGIRVGPAASVPRNSFVRVRGLPPAVSLSEGYATAPGAWAVPLYALPNLQMVVPTGVTGRAEVTVGLISEEGAVLAEASSVLTFETPRLPAPPPQASAAAPNAPPLPKPPVLPPAVRDMAEKFVARAKSELDLGHVAVARQFLLRSAQAGYAEGALMLAATYDPRELARWGVQGVQPDLEEARKWYSRARELGAPEAEARLAGLGSGG